MKIVSVYNNFFKNNMFMKMLFIFSMISIVTIITLSYIIFLSVSDSTIRRELAIQKAAMESVDRYIHQQYESVQNMVRDMHQNEALSANISYLMSHTYADYVQHLTNGYYANQDDYSADVLKHFQNIMDRNADIHQLMLYSAERQDMSMFSPNKQFKKLDTSAAHSYIPDVMAMETPNISAPNYWIRKEINEWSPELYAIRVPINNTQTLRNLGQFLVFFDSAGIGNALDSYESNFKGEIVVLSAKGNVLFDSSSNYYGKKYPYVEVADSLFDQTDMDSMKKEKNMYVNKFVSADQGYVIVATVPVEEMAEAYAGIRNTIISISIISTLFAVLVPAFFIINFAKRTRRIIRFTQKVKYGNLSARIDDTRDDELGQISHSFNDMLDELNLYIERVYKAEIKQKETELVALQARINPHFLYNTLEVIRMRAISQGARDVGEMIYSLSVLFKSLVQQKKNYTLKDEMEACRLYLELFRIRYKDIFTYTIQLDPVHNQHPVVKLSLQPIIENYVVHGIQTERSDNKLSIVVEEIGDVLQVEVRDNGKGIDPARLAEIREELDRPEESGQMFGLRSVHSRLRYLYGPEFGMTIESTLGEGTLIRVRYPHTEGTGV
ncbi:sensor histidine kinase [Paenibacillus illinoisensis]|uniref:sensor histidine kinase n=1 Tax=Paenibacillus illinoisensis TaxID=59845 RepID=UPI0037CC214B